MKRCNLIQIIKQLSKNQFSMRDGWDFYLKTQLLKKKKNNQKTHNRKSFNLSPFYLWDKRLFNALIYWFPTAQLGCGDVLSVLPLGVTGDPA